MADAYPPFTGRFLFEIEGIRIGAFREVSGLSVEIAVDKIEEGGQNEYVHRVPGRMTWPNLVLKRGVTEDDNLLEWFRTASGEGFAEHNTVDRHSATLSMLAADGEVLRAWEFSEAFPVKWKGPEFSADSSSVATEELEIVHHGFRVA